MKVYTINCFILILLVFTKTEAQIDFYKKANAFFLNNVSNGKVDYWAITTNAAEINEIIKDIEGTDVSKLSSDELKAFYINVYNMLVIKLLSEQNSLPRYVTDIKGIFDAKKFKVGGKYFTLNDLMSYVRKTYNDPRVHFAFVPGARSAPQLQSKAFSPTLLDKELEKVTLDELNGRAVKIGHDKKEIVLNKIFDWYREDFGSGMTSTTGIILFVKTHLTDTTKKKELEEALAANYKIVYQAYNWSVNSKDRN
jgi:Protein of unknown function, DUF547